MGMGLCYNCSKPNFNNKNVICKEEIIVYEEESPPKNPKKETKNSKKSKNIFPQFNLHIINLESYNYFSHRENNSKEKELQEKEDLLKKREDSLIKKINNFINEKEQERKKNEENKKKSEEKYKNLINEYKKLELKYKTEMENIRKEKNKSDEKIVEMEKQNAKLIESINKEKIKISEIETKYTQQYESITKISNEKNKLNEKILQMQKENNKQNESITKISNEKNKLNEKILQIQKENTKQNEIINKMKLEYKQKDNGIKKIIAQKDEEINKIKINLNLLKQELKQPKKPKPILIGLNNIGATCYMNATLQCLSNTKELTDFFLKNYQQSRNNIMSNEYYKLIINLWNEENNNNPYSPNSFKEVLSRENPLFAGIAANDSKDLINFLLERFHLELNKINVYNRNNNNNYINTQQDQMNEKKMLDLFLQDFKSKYNSPISNLFYGTMETKSQCHGCQIIKYNFQIYSFLEFPLQQVNQFCFDNGRRSLFNNNGSNPDVNLYECFEYYGKIDLMTGENQMHCNICNRLCDSFYSTTIYSAPNNFIINLNRGKGAIYECKVHFPDQLNIFNFVSYKNGNTVFELYAVICHLGPSSMSGHFVAYCKNRIDNKWYLYNDGMVSLCTRNYQYQEGMPYILFYRALKGS